ncbi:MAG: hypothetical protein ACYC5N_06815 [Endomicrobiales bacterium]
MEISEKEFAVIREISDNHLSDQRTIATRTGFSLGLTNLIIKRLIKGCIKAKQLNQHKIRYHLTPQGFSEKAKMSYAFTIKTITVLHSIKEIINELILAKSREGVNEFIIRGSGDLSDVTEMSFNNLSEIKIKFSRKRDASEQALLECLNAGRTVQSIDLITYVAGKNIQF